MSPYFFVPASHASNYIDICDYLWNTYGLDSNALSHSFEYTSRSTGNKVFKVL